MVNIKIPKQYVSEVVLAKRVFLDIEKTGKWSRPEDLKIAGILERKGFVKSLSHQTYQKTGRFYTPTKKGKSIFGFI